MEKRNMWLRLNMEHTTPEEFESEHRRISALNVNGNPLVFTVDSLSRTIEIHVDDVPLRIVQQIPGSFVNGAMLYRKIF